MRLSSHGGNGADGGSSTYSHAGGSCPLCAPAAGTPYGQLFCQYRSKNAAPQKKPDGAAENLKAEHMKPDNGTNEENPFLTAFRKHERIDNPAREILLT